MSSDIGLYGLAVMGQNFALNMASHGFSVCVGNRSPAKVELTVNRAKEEGNLPLVGSSDVEDFVKQLSKPRKVIILVMAGKPVDETIALLTQYMEEGDVIVDGGNEWFQNTLRRSKELEVKGIHFVGMGISGGEVSLGALSSSTFSFSGYNIINYSNNQLSYDRPIGLYSNRRGRETGPVSCRVGQSWRMI